MMPTGHHGRFAIKNGSLRKSYCQYLSKRIVLKVFHADTDAKMGKPLRRDLQ